MMSDDGRKQLRAELVRIAEQTRLFKPPYIPSRYLQDLSSSDPVDLVRRYVVEKAETSGFERLWLEKRLDLTVENVAWRHRHTVGPEIARAAAARLAAVGFDATPSVRSEAGSADDLCPVPRQSSRLGS